MLRHDSLEERIGALAIGAPISIRVSPRARRLSLRVDAAKRGIELVLPRRFSPETALHFVSSHRGWIAARIAAMPPPRHLGEGASVPVFGVPHRVRHERDPAAPPVAIADGEIRVKGDPAHLPRRVRDHLTALAKRDFAARARTTAARIGKSVTRVGVRDPRSRWGSCSSKGALSFSWRLVLAPEAVIDYVVAHEVAHLVEMNHGARFWRLVASLVPDVDKSRAWLRRHRLELLAYA
ncbi:MAG TPA: SprT family zinc-dependent metalloprotease [Stellaceae bacterium]|nr:SprT family zinc-dependent metalloprotease [Stellaceae bacterium]